VSTRHVGAGFHLQQTRLIQGTRVNIDSVAVVARLVGESFVKPHSFLQVFGVVLFDVVVRANWILMNSDIFTLN